MLLSVVEDVDVVREMRAPAGVAECATCGTHATPASPYRQVPIVAQSRRKPASPKAQPTRNALGQTIRHAREAKGWSQSDLARKLQIYGWDVERTLITKIELRRRCITDYELIAIADVLGISLDELAQGKPSIGPLLTGLK